MEEYIVEAPCFSGFYGYEFCVEELGCAWEYDCQELYNQLREKQLISVFYEKICDLADWGKTYENIAKSLVDGIYYDFFFKWVTDVDFDRLWKPRWYNFQTDKIYVKIKLTKKQLKKIENFCFIKEKESFEKFLQEHYSSRSGFISFITTDIEEFKEEYKKDNECSEKDKIYLSILFNFIYTHGYAQTEDEYVCPFDCRNIYETLVLLEDFKEEEIAKQLIEEYDNNNC
jgi:hypothetical protein